MLQRLSGQLPAWARPDHPVLRYELGKSPLTRLRTRLLRAFGVVFVGVLLLLGGAIIATGFFANPAGQNLTEGLNAVLYWPLLIVQFLVRVVAVGLTAGAVSEEIRRQNWDNLRATAAGAELALRARWASVFYRLRLLLGVVLLVRVVLIFGILYDLTAFQGRYLDLLINGITPDVPLVIGVLLLSLLMTAALLLPITSVGFDAALGLLLSTIIRQRTFNLLVQVLIILVRVAIVSAFVLGVTQYLEGELVATDAGAWLLVAGLGTLADWGLKFLDLGFFGEIWATVPFGVFLGLGLLTFSLVQAILTDQIMNLAVRRAERKG